MTAARPLVAIRPAAARDLDAIVAIERASFGDPWSHASFAALLGNPAVWFRVAEGDAGAVAGYVVTWFAADEGEVANIAVQGARRGHGVGAALLDAALAEAGARGCAAVYLEVRESNAPARALYASRGFEEVGRRRGYYRRPTEDALVLRRAMSVPGAMMTEGA